MSFTQPTSIDDDDLSISKPLPTESTVINAAGDGHFKLDKHGKVKVKIGYLKLPFIYLCKGYQVKSTCKFL